MAIPQQSDYNNNPETITTTTNPVDRGNGGGGGKAPSITDSFSMFFPIVIGSAFVIGITLAFLILWLTRRRRRRGKVTAAAAAAAAGGPGNEAVLISLDGSSAARSSEDDDDKKGSDGRVATGRGKLQKACSVGAAGSWWWAGKRGSGLLSDEEDGEGRGWPRRHVSMPLIPRACTKGHFHFALGGRSESCRWPGEGQGGKVVEMGDGRVCRRKPSWIDEDALHGPKVGAGRGLSRGVELAGGAGGKRKKSRGSWPMRNRAPTLPRLHHTIHGYPYLMSGARDGSSEALLGESQFRTTLAATGMDYAQLRASSRILPELPKPALIANRDRRVARPSVSMGYVYGVSKIPQPIVSSPVSPGRLTPTTPTRHRGRQRSTDSTLHDILRSTEERLREGSVPATIRSRRATASPPRASLDEVSRPREYGVPLSRSRTPSPKKTASKQLFTPGHKRQGSHQSVSSETDSIGGEECPDSDAPAGLTSPSRNQRKSGAEKPVLQAQSVRTSLSSELSTLYSEDEMPDEVKRAIMPLEGLVVQPQQAASVRPPSMNDPFITAPLPLSVSRPSSIGAWPTKHSKSQGLLRQSAQRSQRLRSMTIGHARSRSQGLILAPGPVIQGPRPCPTSVIPHPRQMSVTIPRFIQPCIASRASEPPPSPTRISPTNQSPTGPLFLRVTKTSTLSTIPMLPPPSAPGLDVFSSAKSKPSSPTKTTLKADNQPAHRSTVLMLPSTERSSAPPSPSRRVVGGEMRRSLILAPRQLQELQQHPSQNRSSASSSVYSQEANPTFTTTGTTAATHTATELNRAGFQANSSLYPAPLSPRNSSRAPPPSKLSSELVITASSTCNLNPDCDGNKDNTNSYGPSEVGDEGDDDDDTTLALTCTIASLRRMNSGISTASSLRSIADRNHSPGPSSSLSPEREGAPGPATKSVSGSGSDPVVDLPAKVGRAGGGGSSGGGCSDARRKSIGVRNYFILGNGNGGQSRRVSRVVSCGAGVGVGVGGTIKSSPSGGSGVGACGSGNGGGSGNGSPGRRRRRGTVHHQRRSSAMLRLSCSEFAVGGAGDGKENDDGDGKFKVAAGEFTFEVSNPNSGSGKGGLGLREGSSGSVNALAMPQQKDSQRLSLAWRPAEGGASRNSSPVRFNGGPSRASLRNVDSLGLYDWQGFLISASPVRGVSPSGLRV